MKISVGIPAHNEEQNIKQLINSVLTQTGNFEIEEVIVVSDGSTDKTVSEVGSITDTKIKLIDYKDRVGQALRQNDILEQFKGDLLILLNADVLITDPLFFEKLIKPLINDPKIGIVSPTVAPLPAKTIFENVINFSVALKNEIYTEMVEHNNLYLCHGRARAISRDFAKLLRFPGVAGEDAFSYITCIKNNYKFYYQPEAEIQYRSPQNLTDHLKQSKRFFKGREKLSEIFGNVDEYYQIPPNLILKKAFKFFIRNPIYFLSYMFVLANARFFAYFHKPQVAWDESLSSKNLFS